MTAETTRPSRFARLAVLLAAAWLLTGALAKLFAGNPMTMPEPVRKHSPFDLDLTFHLVIAVELSLVTLALVKPRFGWAPLAGLFAFFLALLAPMVIEGAESCGCMGESLKFPPALMLSIDGALLLLLLASRPWSALSGPGLPALLLAAGLVVAWAAPWVVIRSSAGPVAPVPQAADGSTPPAPPSARYVPLDTERWVGKQVFDIEQLTRWLPAEQLPIEGSIVLWRQSCDHCAAHLRAMANRDDGTKQILLMQVRDDLKNARAVDALPQGGHVQVFEFPENQDVAVETPCEVVVEGGVVKAVLTKDDFHDE